MSETEQNWKKKNLRVMNETEVKSCDVIYVYYSDGKIRACRAPAEKNCAWRHLPCSAPSLPTGSPAWSVGCGTTAKCRAGRSASAKRCCCCCRRPRFHWRHHLPRHPPLLLVQQPQYAPPPAPPRRQTTKPAKSGAKNHPTTRVIS